MSKFCGNCGTELADDAMFCGNCGTTMDTQPAPAPAAPVASVADASATPVAPIAPVAKKKPNIVKIIIPAIAVVLALVIGFSAFSVLGEEENYFMSYNKEIRYNEDGEVIATEEIKYDKPNRVVYYLDERSDTTEVWDDDLGEYKEVEYDYKQEITIDYSGDKIKSIKVVEEDSREDAEPLSYELNFEYSKGTAKDSYTVTTKEYDDENSYWDDDTYEWVEVYKDVTVEYTIEITYDGDDVTVTKTSDEENASVYTLKLEEKGRKKTTESKYYNEVPVEDENGDYVWDDEAGEYKTTVKEYVNTSVYTYDKYGNRLTGERTEDGKTTYEYEAEYDGKNMIREEYSESYDDTTHKYETECEYDKKDNLIAKETTRDGKTSYEYEAEYDGELLLTSKTTYYDDYGTNTYEYEYEYDKKGRMTSYTTYDDGTKSYYVELDEQDGKEYTYKAYSYDNGEETKEGKMVCEYSGDKIVSTKSYDADGNLDYEATMNKRGERLTYASYSIKYDDEGNEDGTYKSYEGTCEYKYASAKNRAVVDVAEWIID